jgi:hypothetical protein
MLYLLRDTDNRKGFFISNKSFRKDGPQGSQGDIIYTLHRAGGDIFIYRWLGHFVGSTLEQTSPLTFIVIMGASIEEVYKKGINMGPGGVFEGRLERLEP